MDDPKRVPTKALADTLSHGATDSAALADFSRYRIDGELSRGGLGCIYRAHDLQLDRPIALKVPLSGASALRFEREARLTARLQHPSIVTVYEAGSAPTGQPFYAMRWVAGRPLGEAIAAARTADERLALLPHVITVADAVAYAHSHRIIHRDIKPSNIVVGAFGETVLLDWGIAKDLAAPEIDAAPVEGTPGQTAEGAVLGTPAYMAPEQALGSPVDERADVYALGALLYEVLSGKPPYVGRAGEVLAALAEGPPAPLSPQLPADLQAIVGKAMARDPGARYPTASELASDLRRFATGQLVSSHRYSLGALLRRWLARHRILVSAAAVALVAIAAVGAVSVRRIERARLDATRRRDELLLAQARVVLPRDPTASAAWLKQYPVEGADWVRTRSLLSEVEQAGVAQKVFRDLQLSYDSPWGDATALGYPGRVVVFSDGKARTLAMGDDANPVMTFLPDGRQLVTYGSQRALRAWDFSTGQSRTLWRGEPGDECTGFEASADGKWLACALPKGTMLLISVEDGRVRRLAGQEDNIHDWRFSPDSKWLASGGVDKVVHLWSVATGEQRLVGKHDQMIRAVAFSREGLLATAGHDRVIRIWDLAGGPPRVLSGHTGAILSAFFSPDGKQLVSGGEDHTVRVWDVATGQARVLAGHQAGVVKVAFAPDGRRVASAGDDATVRVWNLEDGEARVLRGHAAPILVLSFTPDGRALRSQSLDGEHRRWELLTSSERVFRGVKGGALAVSYSHDGRHLAWSSFEGSVQLCAPDGACTALPGSPGRVGTVAFSPDDKWLAWGGGDGVVRLWNLAERSLRELPGHGVTIRQVLFSTDGLHLASAGEDRTVRWWDLASGAGRVVTTHDDWISSIALSADGLRVASTGLDTTVRLYDVATGRSQVWKGHTGWVMALAFAPDGKQLASASWDGTVRIWDLEGHELQRFVSRRPATVDFSPDGHWLAAGDGSGAVQLFNRSTAETRSWREHQGGLRHVLFSPDGRFLASGGEDKTVRVWEVATGEARVMGLHDAAVRRLSFSPDGKSLASCGSDAALRLWPIAWHDQDASTARNHLTRLTSTVIDAEGHVATP